MKLKDLKNVVAINHYIIIENRNKEPLLHGYLDWFVDTELENNDIVSIYAEQNIIHVMIK